MLEQPARLAALRRTGLLSPEPSIVLDGLARTVTRLLGVPVSLVTLVDDAGQWFPGLSGLDGWAADARHTPLTHSFCQHVVTTAAPLVVDDATLHPLVHQNLAIDDLDVRAYIGIPLTSADGHVLGALCAIDAKPRHWTEQDQEGLRDLAAAASAELRRCERELRFQLAVDATQEVVYTHDHAVGVVERHGAVEALYGRPADQLADSSEGWLDCIAPEDRARVADSWSAALKRGSGRWQCEYRMQHPDGTVVIIEDRASILTDAAGAPVHVAGAMRDVTRERQAEAERRAAEARWRHLLEVAYEGICTVDAEGIITYANPRMAEMLHCGREELPDLDFFELLDPSEATASRVRFADQRSGTRHRHEVRMRRRDGLPLWVLEASSPILNADGSFAGALYLCSDITARREIDAERTESAAALRTSEAQLRLALDVAGMIVWERDLSSDHIRDLVAAPDGAQVRADAMGDYATFLAAVHPEDRARVAEANAVAVASGGDFRIEHRITGADGTERWIRTVGGVVGGGDEGLRRVVGVALDVTEQHTLEEQFRHAQKLEAVGLLASGIAHDFNNLLTVIYGSLELLRMDLPQDLPADHPVRADAAEIAHASERAQALVRQLLTFSRKQPVRPQHLDLGAVVRDAQRLLRRVIGEEINLRVEIGAVQGTVNMDAGQLEQVLMNLTVNARDALLTARHGYAGEGGTLTLAVDMITLRPSDLPAWTDMASGHVARLRVIDTGHGMDAEARERVFEPFFTTKEVGRGTGLGLATVFGIVRQAGGGISVESSPGVGTTFTVLLPLVSAPTDASDHLPKAHTPVSGATILLVEDDAAVRTMARRLLERSGYAVHDAANGRQALRVWAERSGMIDAVVTDVRMPEMGGPQLVAELRAIEPTLPVVFMSGYSDGDPRAENSAGATDEGLVAKPFTREALADALESVLSARRAGVRPPRRSDLRRT